MSEQVQAYNHSNFLQTDTQLLPHLKCVAEHYPSRLYRPVASIQISQAPTRDSTEPPVNDPPMILIVFTSKSPDPMLNISLDDIERVPVNVRFAAPICICPLVDKVID